MGFPLCRVRKISNVCGHRKDGAVFKSLQLEAHLSVLKEIRPFTLRILVTSLMGTNFTSNY
jgi:hypothetical protein